MAEPFQEMRALERRIGVEESFLLKGFQRSSVGLSQGPVDVLARRHSETGVFRAQAFGQRADHFVVRAAFPRRLDELRAKHQMRVPAALIEIVMLHEHRRRQHDIRHRGGFRHELLVDDREEILARKAPLHLGLIRRDRDRIGVLDQHRGDGRTVFQCLGFSGQHLADAGLIEQAHLGVKRIQPLDHALGDAIGAGI